MEPRTSTDWEHQELASLKRKLFIVCFLTVVIVLLYLLGVAIAYFILGLWAVPTAMRLGFWLGVPIALVGGWILLVTSRDHRGKSVDSRFASLSAIFTTLPLIVATGLMYLPPADPGDGLASSPLLAGLGRAFQHSFEQSMAEAREESRKRDLLQALQIAALEDVTLEEFDSSWKIKVTARQQPALELLDDLLKPLGWSAESSAETKSALNRRVSLDLRDVSRWEAIETVCRMVGVTPIYPSVLNSDDGSLSAGFAGVRNELDGQSVPRAAVEKPEALAGESRVTFTLGVRSLPVSFAGPILIELKELEENVGTATGRLKLSSWAHGLSPSIQAIDQHSSPVEVESITGSDGSDLIANYQSGWMGNFPWSSRDYLLRGLLQPVEAATVSGIARLNIPTNVAAVTFESPLQESSQDVGDGTVEITKYESGKFDTDGWGPKPGVRLQLQGKGLSGELLLTAYDRNQEILTYEIELEARFGNQSHLAVAIRGEPEKLIVKIPVAVESRSYPFQIPKISLNKFASQPSELEPLNFGNRDSPISIDVLGVDRDEAIPDLNVRVTNHANLGIESIEVTLQYLDEFGKRLKSQPASDSAFGKPDEPLVKPYGEAALTWKAFFLPEEATQVQVVLRKVRFSDFRTWEPPDND